MTLPIESRCCGRSYKEPAKEPTDQELPEDPMEEVLYLDEAGNIYWGWANPLKA